MNGDHGSILPPVSELHELISLAEIDRQLSDIAGQLNQRLNQRSVTLLCVMTGGLVTTGYLLPKLMVETALDYLHVSRYRQQTVGDDLQWKRYPDVNLKDKTVLLVDDIFDEGITMASVKDYCLEQGAAEVISVVLLTKLHKRQQTTSQPDYSAFSIPDVYVFGFGLDYHDQGRNLPGIYCFKNQQE